jgi:predicted amidohydrolase
MLTKVVCVQAVMGHRLNLEEKLHILKQRPDFVCLSEYCLLDESVGDYGQAADRHTEHLAYFRKLSTELSTCLIAGTVVEREDDRLYNASYVIDRGIVLGAYRKRYPVPGEQSRGILPGSRPLFLTVDDIRIGVLICGDVFYPEQYDEMGLAGIDIVFVPTTSLYRPDDSLSQKRYRDRKYFVDGAERAGAYVVKVCGVGRVFDKPLQGRSLVTAPWGILAQVSLFEEMDQRILAVTLDIAEIREFRRKYIRSSTESDRAMN